jgi:hypothetical protein
VFLTTGSLNAVKVDDGPALLLREEGSGMDPRECPQDEKSPRGSSSKSNRRRRCAFLVTLVLVLIPALHLNPLVRGQGHHTEYFAQIAIGGGCTTTFAIRNLGSSATAVEIQLLSSSGGLLASNSAALPANGSLVVPFGGDDGSLQAGWAKLSSEGDFLATEFFEVKLDSRVLPQVGVLPSPPAPRIILFGFSSPSINTGFAVANPSETKTDITMRLRGTNGQVELETHLSLESGQHLSRFLSEVFERESFEGTVEIVAEPEPVTFATLLQDAAGNITTVPVLVPSERIASCQAIQDAIDALPLSGGQILVPAGTYTCDTAIVIDRDNVDLRGQGPGTTLRLADGANSPLLVLGQSVTPATVTRKGLHVSDLVIDGNRDGQTVECWGGPCDTGGLTFVRNNGVALRRVADSVVERVTVMRARSGGLVCEKGSRRVTIKDFTAFDNYFDGVAAYETEESLLSNLYLHDNLAAGFSFDIGFHRNVINNAHLWGNGLVGVFMRDSQDNVFYGLQVRNSGEHGIFLAQVDSDTTKPASGNTFTGCVVSASAGAGLAVNDASCINNLAVGCQFIGNQAGCVSEATPGLLHQTGTVCR